MVLACPFGEFYTFEVLFLVSLLTLSCSIIGMVFRVHNLGFANLTKTFIKQYMYLYKFLPCFGQGNSPTYKTRPIAISCVLRAISNRRTNQRMDGWTNKAAYRVACM